MKFNVDIARIEYFQRQVIEADTIDEALELANDNIMNGLVSISDSGDHYEKVYNEETGKLIRDTEKYCGWSIADVEQTLKEKLLEVEATKTADELSELATDITSTFVKFVDFSDLNYALNNLIDEEVADLATHCEQCSNTFYKKEHTYVDFGEQIYFCSDECRGDYIHNLKH